MNDRIELDWTPFAISTISSLTPAFARSSTAHK